MIPYTGLKHHERQNLIDVIPLKKPFTLIIEPTSQCNFSCIQCFQSVEGESYFTRTRSVMNLACFEKVMEQLKSWPGPRFKVLKLSLYGEPLINKAFCDMLRLVKAADVAERVETTTNASLLTESIAERLVEIGLDYLRVSIYSALPEKHRAITKSAIPLERIYDNLAVLKRVKQRHGSEKPFVGVKMLDTYSDENRFFEERFRDVADEVFLDKPHNWVSVEGKSFIGDLYGEGAARALADSGVSGAARVACTQPFFTLAVRSNGDVAPCCIDWVGGTILGNINQETLEEIWNGDRMFEFRKMHLEGRRDENESCRNCEFLRSDHYTRDTVDGFPVERLR